MKKFMLCIMGSLIALFVVFWCCISYTVNYKKITCDTSVSPDKKYEVVLQAVGEPEWPFGSASGRLVLKEGEDKISQTDFELHNDGASISSSCWKVTWHEDYVEIILSGEEQIDEQVILYFDGTKEIQQLTDVADIEVEYPSGERLDESRVITEQSFDVELNDWGEVQFVSYLPTYETLWEDVSFVLAKDNQIIYYFPECYENNSTENDSVGMFDSVEAVGFQDIDGDGAKDVIVIINYVTGAGPQGMMPRKTIRIFSSQDNGFVIQHDLMDELMENMNEDDISIPAICDYVTLMETNEIYDGYDRIAKGIDINTLDAFQGRENDIIIYSTVRTKNSIGFQKEKERVNVAFSRAKNLLIICGDMDFFYKFDDPDNKFIEIIDYICEHEDECLVIPGGEI